MTKGTLYSISPNSHLLQLHQTQAGSRSAAQKDHPIPATLQSVDGQIKTGNVAQTLGNCNTCVAPSIFSSRPLVIATCWERPYRSLIKLKTPKDKDLLLLNIETSIDTVAVGRIYAAVWQVSSGSV